MLATYDWQYVDKRKNFKDPNGFWNVEMYRDDTGLWQYGANPNKELNLQRALAGRETVYDKKTDSDYAVDWIDRTSEDHFCKPWNYQLQDLDSTRRVGKAGMAWAEQPWTANEVGSTFTIQGFDLNYAGVIIGPSVGYKNGQITFDSDKSANRLAKPDRKDLGDTSAENLFRNELSVLLKRGVHGLYLFALNAELQDFLINSVIV